MDLVSAISLKISLNCMPLLQTVSKNREISIRVSAKPNTISMQTQRLSKITTPKCDNVPF